MQIGGPICLDGPRASSALQQDSDIAAMIGAEGFNGAYGIIRENSVFEYSDERQMARSVEQTVRFVEQRAGLASHR